MKTLTNQQLENAHTEWSGYMQRALELASEVQSTTPNPRVGCIIVKNSQIVGEGWHAAAGCAHAEAVALEEAQEKAQGGIAFVTLEPCCHTGRTGPCTDALIKAGLKAVVIAVLDPDSRVSGKGVRILELAGIEVFHLKDFETYARDLNLGYFKRQEKGLPFVRLKLAMSLDGRTALASGESKWITGASSRSDVQRLRARSSAVITGVNTVLKDDPALNVRPEEIGLNEKELVTNAHSLAIQPLRVVLDSKLQIPKTARILLPPGHIKIFNTSNLNETRKLADNVEILQADADERRVDLKSMLRCLASEFSCNDVLIEAGPTLSGSFIEKELVDELIIYIAPIILGSDAKPLFEMTGFTALPKIKKFHVFEVVKIGDDIKVVLTKI